MIFPKLYFGKFQIHSKVERIFTVNSHLLNTEILSLTFHHTGLMNVHLFIVPSTRDPSSFLMHFNVDCKHQYKYFSIYTYSFSENFERNKKIKQINE